MFASMPPLCPIGSHPKVQSPKPITGGLGAFTKVSIYRGLSHKLVCFCYLVFFCSMLELIDTTLQHVTFQSSVVRPDPASETYCYGGVHRTALGVQQDGNFREHNSVCFSLLPFCQYLNQVTMQSLYMHRIKSILLLVPLIAVMDYI